MEDSEVVFDRVLHSVGENGRFQKRFNVLFNFLLPAAGTLTYMNLILVMVIPDHWCHVPGREELNATFEDWRNITLPRQYDAHGQETYSSCKMYNITNNFNLTEDSISDHETVDCQFGYEYDKTWYRNTIPSSQNWVCDKVLYSANIIAAAKFGEVFGGLLMGYLGDLIGRRAVYYIAMLLMLSSRLVTPFVTQWYPVLMAMSIIATFPSMMISQSCMVILMEISPAEDRAFLSQIQNIGWTFGLAVLPLIYWLLKDWFIYMLVTTIPLAIYILLSVFMIESPRWLLSRGRVAECVKQLKTIAKVNGTTLSPNSSLLLQNSTATPEKTYGIWSLFSNWRLAKNTVLLLITWIGCLLNYYTLVFAASNMSGNPFLNFFLQSIAEVPSYLFGKILCDKIGRRFTGIFGFLVGLIGYITLIITINDQDKVWLHTLMMIISKFSTSIVYFVISLQSLEIYPTSVRQSGFTLNLTAGNLFGTLSPYVVHLGLLVNAKLPYLILAILSIIGAVAETFLPETLNEHLPETLNEARKFGMNQRYFSLPGKKRDTYILANVKFINRHLSENGESELVTQSKN